MKRRFLLLAAAMVRSGLRSLCTSKCLRLSLSLSVFVHLAVAQEVSFTPRYDGVAASASRPKRTPTGEPDVPKAPKLYSLGRFNLLFQGMCELLEADSRRDRVFRISKKGAEDEQECPTCRALFRQIAQSCSPKPKAKKPTQGITSGIQDRTEADPPVNSPQPPQQGAPKRYPRTDLVDVLSQLSEGLYEFSPGTGPVFEALRSFESRLVGGSDQTPGERDYFGIVLAYLFSAWAGRPGSPLEAATPSPEEISELFQ